MRRLIILTILVLLLAGYALAESQKPPPPLRQGQPRNFDSAEHNAKQNIDPNRDKDTAQPPPIQDKVDPSKKESKPAPCSNPKCNNQLGAVKDDPIAGYTLWLMIFTGLLVVFNALLWITTACLAKDSKKAADAAKESADALPTIERAYIFVAVDVNGDELRRASTAQAIPPYAKISIRISNEGKTPAILTSFRVRVDKKTTYPKAESIDSFDNSIVPGTYIGSGAWIIPHDKYLVTADTCEKITNGAESLICYGRLTYNDIFGKPHESGFCWETHLVEAGSTTITNPNIFTISHNEELNYYK